MKTYTSIGFACNTLASLFMVDPECEKHSSLYDSFSTMDVTKAGKEWPFVDDRKAAEFLSLIKEGILEGYDQLPRESLRLFNVELLSESLASDPEYTEGVAVVCSMTELALNRWIDECEIDKKQTERAEGHVGQLLTLMAWVAMNIPELTLNFIYLHFLPWADHFLRLLYMSTNHAFYKGLSLLCLSTLRGMRTELEQKVA